MRDAGQVAGAQPPLHGEGELGDRLAGPGPDHQAADDSVPAVKDQ